MKISDLILMSDVDGTLLLEEEIIPRRNIEALNRFTQKGGKFSIATGRSTAYTMDIVKQLPVNFPCVVYNGGGLYDFQRQEYLMEHFLPDCARENLLELMERFPQVNYVVVNQEAYYKLDDERNFAQYSRSGSRNPYMKQGNLLDLRGKWYKILMLMEKDDVQSVMEYGTARFSELRFVLTNNTMMEILPFQSTKAFAIQKLMELKNFSADRLVCIGDYYNDLEMLQLAGTGVTLETSPEDIREIAQMVVCRCQDGALADLVERLEARYGG